MDSEDSNAIYQDLTNLHSENDNLFRLVKEQVAVIKSNFETLSKPIQEISAETKNIQEQLSELLFQYQSDTRSQTNTTNFLLLNQKFLEISNLLLIKCVAINKNQGHTLNILNTIHDNKLHPLLLTSQKVMESIEKFEATEFDKTILNESHMSQLTKVDSLEVNGTVVIRIEVPSPQRERFQLYKTYITPIRYNNSLLSYKIPEEFIAVDKIKNKFITLTEKQYSECGKILVSFTKTVLLCEHKNPINTDTKNSCVFNLLDNPFNRTPNCEIVSANYHNYLTRLVTPNAWLFTTQTQIQIKINCQDSSQTVSLIDSGTILFKTNCDITAENFILPVSGSRTTTLIIVQPDQPAFPDEILVNPLSPKQIKQTPNKLMKITDFSVHNELMKEQAKINHLESTVEETQKSFDRNQKSSLTPDNLITIFSSGALVTIIIIIVAICKFRKRCNPHPDGSNATIINVSQPERSDREPVMQVMHDVATTDNKNKSTGRVNI